ncbi:MAG: hypothetical protein V8S58_14385 [Lachnospiraceae bacterium]
MCKDAGIPVVYINRETGYRKKRKRDGLLTAKGHPGAKPISGQMNNTVHIRVKMVKKTANKGDINGDGKVNYIMVQGNAKNVKSTSPEPISIVKALTDAKDLDRQKNSPSEKSLGSGKGAADRSGVL